MKGKRGILLKETLYLIVALMFLAVVGAGAYEVYKNVTSDKDKADALGTLDRLSFFLNDISKNVKIPFLVYSPKDYYFTYRENFKVPSDPFLCNNQKCMCFCEKKDCSNENSFCKQLNLSMTMQGPVQISSVGEMVFEVTNTAYNLVEVKSLNLKTSPSTEIPGGVMAGVDTTLLGTLPAFKERPSGTIIDTVVLHYTLGSSAQSAYDWWKTQYNQGVLVSAHYIIDRDGTIWYIIDDSKEAYHVSQKDNAEANTYSIGIELINLGTQYYTNAQYNQLNALLNYLRAKYPYIKLDEEHIVGHHKYSKKDDPGKCFDWTRIGLKEPIYMMIQDKGYALEGECH